MHTHDGTLRRAIGVAMGALLGATAALATDITWTGGSGDWTNAAKWNPPQVPTASDHVLLGSGSVTVPPSATFSNLDWTGGTISGALTVASNAVLNLGGSSLKELHGPLTNAGLVRVTGNGQFNLYSGPIENLVGGVIDFQADVTWAGVPAATLDNAGTLRKSGGSGTTMIGYPGYPIFVGNSGTIEAGTGTLNLRTGYSNSPSAVLAISLGGAAPGSGYGRIDFTSPLALGGTFTASTRNGFRPAPGQRFLVLSYPLATNAFTCITGMDLGAGLMLQPHFAATSLTLTAATYRTNTSLPDLLISRSQNDVVVQWPLGFAGWVLQSTTNLAAPVWPPVSGGCGNLAQLPATVPWQYFRLHNGN